MLTEKIRKLTDLLSYKITTSQVKSVSFSADFPANRHPNYVLKKSLELYSQSINIAGLKMPTASKVNVWPFSKWQ